MSTPPWEELPPHEDEDVQAAAKDLDFDVCDHTGYVTQGQFSALLQMVKDQRKLIDRLSVQLAGLINKNPGRPNPPPSSDEKHDGTKLLAGKHRGKTFEQVVLQAPDYVIWLHDNGWSSRWGFDDRHVEAAKKAVELGISSRN